MLYNLTQDDEWFIFWQPIIIEILSCWNSQKNNGTGGWDILPFPGGLYDQDIYNPLTWEIWNLVINIYYQELSAKRAKEGANAADDTNH